jgi:hypothetical protein
VYNFRSRSRSAPSVYPRHCIANSNTRAVATQILYILHSSSNIQPLPPKFAPLLHIYPSYYPIWLSSSRHSAHHLLNPSASSISGTTSKTCWKKERSQRNALTLGRCLRSREWFQYCNVAEWSPARSQLSELCSVLNIPFSTTRYCFLSTRHSVL